MPCRIVFYSCFSVPCPSPFHSSLPLHHGQLHSSSLSLFTFLQECQFLRDALCKGSGLFVIRNPWLALDLHFRALQLLRLDLLRGLRLGMYLGSHLPCSPVIAVERLAALGCVCVGPSLIRLVRRWPSDSWKWLRGSTVATFNVCDRPFMSFFLGAIAGFTLESFAAACDL